MEIAQLEAAKVAFDNEFEGLDDGKLLHRQIVQLAAAYLKLRIDWSSSDLAGRIEIDATRTKAHDAFIAIFDAFTRRAAARGSTLAWRRVFGTGGAAEERKRLGDFACYLAFDLAIRAR